jgi:hypothetical protein
MSLQAHISELEAKRQALKDEIEREMSHPSADDLHIAELKRKKLWLKDEIARLQSSVPAA